MIVNRPPASRTRTRADRSGGGRRTEADTLAGSLHATGSRSHAPLGVPDAWLRRRGVEGRQRVSRSHTARYLISPPPDARVAPSRLAALSPQRAPERAATVASRWPSLCQPRLGSLPRLRSVRSDRFTFRDAQLPAVGVPSSPTSGSSISPSCHRNHSRAHSALIRFSSSVISPSATAWYHARTSAWARWASRRRFALPSTRPGAEHHRVTSALPLREHRAALGTHGHLARLPDPAPAPHGSFGTGAGGVAPASVEPNPDGHPGQ